VASAEWNVVSALSVAPSLEHPPDASLDERPAPHAIDPIAEPLPPIVAALLADARGFAFFQAVRLLEASIPGGLRPAYDRGRDAARVELRPHDGLAFPATDVHHAEPLTGTHRGIRLALSFHGLYGVDAPLPGYVGAAVASAEPEARALRDFLDIFNHRLYTLFYESWRKYRPSVDGRPAGAEAHRRRVFCLAGLGAPVGEPLAASPITPSRLAPFAALLRTPVRTADGLLRLVRHFFPDITVTIDENVPRWVAIPERPRLGAAAAPMTLGKTALLGSRVLDVAGGFRLSLGPLTWPQYQRFRPRGDDAVVLAELVRLYAPDSLHYDVELRISAAELPLTTLGSPTNRLGRTTWVGRPRDAIVSDVVPYV
jgi:type VI secretion system protein ImpH